MNLLRPVLIFSCVLLTISLSTAEKSYWRKLVDEYQYDEKEDPRRAGEIKLIKYAIENRRLEDSLKQFGDPAINDSVWVDIVSAEAQVKKEVYRDYSLNRWNGIKDTENITVGYPFKFYTSRPEIRCNYKSGNTFKSITDSIATGYIFPIWYRNITMGRIYLDFPDASFSYSFCLGGSTDLGELRTCWPLKNGYKPIIVRVDKSGSYRSYEYYFHIPQVDSTNFTPMDKDTDAKEMENLVNELKRLAANKQHYNPANSFKGRYYKLSTFNAEIERLRNR